MNHLIINRIMVNLLLLVPAVLLHAQKNIPVWRLSRITFYSNEKKSPDMAYYFSYDNNGRLIKEKYFQNGQMFDSVTHFTYDKEGKILSCRMIALVNTYPSPVHDYFFKYDSNRRLIKYYETHKRSDGQEIFGEVYTYCYDGDKVTRIFQNRGTSIDTLEYVMNSDGYIMHKKADSAHTNPLAMLGSGNYTTEISPYPIDKYFVEKSVSYKPGFGTTKTNYTYNSYGLLIKEKWNYTTEKENVQTATGSTEYQYINLKGKNTNP